MDTDEATLERRLRTDGIDVHGVARRPDAVTVAYVTTLPGAEPDHHEMGTVCNTFIDLIEDPETDLDPLRVDAVSLRHPEDVQATWHVEPAWFEGLTETYRLSEEDFSERVLSSVETDPELDPAEVPTGVESGADGDESVEGDDEASAEADRGERA